MERETKEEADNSYRQGRSDHAARSLGNPDRELSTSTGMTYRRRHISTRYPIAAYYLYLLKRHIPHRSKAREVHTSSKHPRSSVHLYTQRPLTPWKKIWCRSREQGALEKKFISLSLSYLYMRLRDTYFHVFAFLGPLSLSHADLVLTCLRGGFDPKGGPLPGRLSPHFIYFISPFLPIWFSHLFVYNCMTCFTYHPSSPASGKGIRIHLRNRAFCTWRPGHIPTGNGSGPGGELKGKGKGTEGLGIGRTRVWKEDSIYLAGR